MNSTNQDQTLLSILKNIEYLKKNVGCLPTTLVICDLTLNKDKRFFMTNYKQLAKEFGEQVKSNIIENYGGKICYYTPYRDIVELSYAFLHEAIWVELT